jgi:xanthine dehydrogenase YagT iron-sulfur-binding subunit
MQGVGIGSGAIGAGLLQENAQAATGGNSVGPGEVPITLWVNGKEHTLKVEPRVTLLNALRERLSITGAKRVCDRGTCGACTVMVEGKAVYACSMLAIDAQDKNIQTIEGMAKGGELHPMTKAFVKHDAQQCGFCTPGFVVAATAFVNENPNPTEEDAAEGLGGNLCRCGTYMGIRKAVVEAAKAMGGKNA